MNGLRKPKRPMPTGAKNGEGRPQGQPSSEHCSARRLATKPHSSLLRLLDAVRNALEYTAAGILRGLYEVDLP